MASPKQSLPSFASILSVLSIVFYCAGFLRVELELNEQKKRINDLEDKQENKPPDVPNRDKLNAHGIKSFLFWLNILLRASNRMFFFYLFFNKNSCECRKSCIYGRYLVRLCVFLAQR